MASGPRKSSELGRLPATASTSSRTKGTASSGIPRIREASAGRRSTRLTDGIDAGAWRIGNSEVVDQISFSVEERLKRQIVQDSMRSNDEVGGTQPLTNGSDQCFVEVLPDARGLNGATYLPKALTYSAPR